MNDLVQQVKFRYFTDGRLGDHNYCRNPAERYWEVWCYTSGFEWQWCTVPTCSKFGCALIWYFSTSRLELIRSSFLRLNGCCQRQNFGLNILIWDCRSCPDLAWTDSCPDLACPDLATTLLLSKPYPDLAKDHAQTLPKTVPKTLPLPCVAELSSCLYGFADYKNIQV